MKPIYERIFQEAKPFLRTRKNLIHTKIVLKYALRLLEEEYGDEAVVVPAVLLHDVGWKVIPEKVQLTAFGPNVSNPELARIHEVEGAKIAMGILKALDYSSGKVKEICQIIRGHDTRKRSLSRNDRIMKDADKLFRYSRKGVAIDTNRFRVSRESRLHYLERQIKTWLFLRTSRQWAREELARRIGEKE
jgi:HD superfamily phosphodiesterase